MKQSAESTDLLPVTRLLHYVATIGKTIEKLLCFRSLVQHVIRRNSQNLDDLHYLVELQQNQSNKC